MKIDRAGVPYVAVPLAAGAAALAWFPAVSAGCCLAAVMLAYFFRDPERIGPASPEVALAPADGRVLIAGRPEQGMGPAGQWQLVSIFLSPLDVHVNRIPVSGRLVRVVARRGRFLPAYAAEAVTRNACNELWIEREGEMIVCRQVAGVLVRRVVCRLQAGADVRAGERFGIMTFGSRMDVFLPERAILRVTVGQRVRGGETVIAAFGGGG